MTVSDSLLRQCTGLLLGLAVLFLGSAVQAQKVLDPYWIKRTVLSSDGRYMAFDFSQISPDERRRAPYAIAVYDMAAETIELHVAPPPREFHSTSFSPDDRFLAVIQVCWSVDCSPDEIGRNVGAIDRKTRAFQLLTSGQHQVYDMNHRGYQEPKPMRVMRGFPVFDPFSERIYFTSRLQPFSFNPENAKSGFSISKIHGRDGSSIGYIEITESGREEKHLRLATGMYNTVIDGRSTFAYLSATEKGIVAYARLPTDLPYHEKGVWGGIINPDNGEFSPLFPDPPYFNGPDLARSNFRTDSLRAARDGKVLVFSHAYQSVNGLAFDPALIRYRSMLIARDGNVVDQFRPPTGVGPGEVAISGDGRKAIMTVFNDSRIFWAVDLETRMITEKPLRAPLEAAIAGTRLRDVMPPPPPSQKPVNGRSKPPRPAGPAPSEMP